MTLETSSDSMVDTIKVPAPPPVPQLTPGDYAPRRVLTADGTGVLFDLDMYAGRYTLLAFMGSAALPDYAVVQKTLAAAVGIFLQSNAQFVGVGIDVDSGRGAFPEGAHIEMVGDPAFRIATAYGAFRPSEFETQFTPLWMIIDPSGRVRDVLPLGRPDRAFELYMHVLKAASLLFRRHLPIFEQSRVLEIPFCQALVEEMAPQVHAFPDMPGVAIAPLGTSTRVKDVLQKIERRLVSGVRNAFDFPAKTVENLTFVRRSYNPQAKLERLRIRSQAALQDKLVMAVWLPLDEHSHRGGNLSFPEFSDTPVETAQGAALVHSGQLLRQVSTIDSEQRFFIELLIKG